GRIFAPADHGDNVAAEEVTLPDEHVGLDVLGGAGGLSIGTVVLVRGVHGDVVGAEAGDGGVPLADGAALGDDRGGDTRQGESGSAVGAAEVATEVNHRGDVAAGLADGDGRHGAVAPIDIPVGPL